jgi:hypothetical protein
MTAGPGQIVGINSEEFERGQLGKNGYLGSRVLDFLLVN